MSNLKSITQERFDNLTIAELRLLETVCSGELAVCGPNDNLNAAANNPARAETWGNDRLIRGELIRWLCTDPQASPFVSHGGIQVIGARITGPLNLLSVSIHFPLVFAGCEFDNEINLQSAHVRTVSFTQTYLQSIYADGVVVAGAFFFRAGRADNLQFSGARVEGQFDCNNSKFVGLILDGATIGVGLILRGIRGTAKMSGARVAADLDCERATFDVTNRSAIKALDAEGIKVEGSVFLRRGFRALGEVSLLGAQVGMNIDCSGGEFSVLPEATHGKSDAPRADLVDVKGTVFLSNGFRARGPVYFISAQIGGDLSCDRATFGSGLTVERATIKGAFFWQQVILAEGGELDIINTTVDSLNDARDSWPARNHLKLNGFVYRRISQYSPSSAPERLDWLERQKSFAPQPYRQLARVLKDEGDDAGARKVLFEMECQRPSTENLIGRAWNSALRLGIGYGYRPQRALLWFIGLVFLGFLHFNLGFHAGNMVPTDKDAYARSTETNSLPAYYERFHPFIYSLENSLPLFSVGHVQRWQPDPVSRTLDVPGDSEPFRLLLRLASPTSLRCSRWFQALVGWFLATLWIGGVTGLIRKD